MARARTPTRRRAVKAAPASIRMVPWEDVHEQFFRLAEEDWKRPALIRTVVTARRIRMEADLTTPNGQAVRLTTVLARRSPAAAWQYAEESMALRFGLKPEQAS